MRDAPYFAIGPPMVRSGRLSLRAARAYLGDFLVWQQFCAQRELDVLAAGRVHVDLWVTGQADAEAFSIRRRLSAITSFYRYCAAHDLIDRIPTTGVARLTVDPDYTATVGLDRDQAARCSPGGRRHRTGRVAHGGGDPVAATTALPVDEATGAEIAHLGADKGHRVVQVVDKGQPAGQDRVAAGDLGGVADLEDRAARAGLADWQQLRGPFLATATGGRMRQSHLWELVRRVAKAAGLECWVGVVAALVAAHRDHVGVGRRRHAAGRAGLRPAQGPAYDRPLRPHPAESGPVPAYTLASYLS